MSGTVTCSTLQALASLAWQRVQRMLQPCHLPRGTVHDLHQLLAARRHPDQPGGQILNVARFPVTTNGVIDYARDNIEITSVAGTGYSGGGGTAKQIADSIRDGEGVVVSHGLDYDGNGTYTVSDPEGVSELGARLPAEATDPAAWGVLR